MIYLSDNLTMRQAWEMANSMDCYLKNDGKGNSVITPKYEVTESFEDERPWPTKEQAAG